MKAWMLKAYNTPLEMVAMETPRPGRNEIVLKVHACGICQTDIKIINGEIPPPIVELPHVMGHEIAGEVATIGDAVEGVTVGDVGFIYIYIPCRRCPLCLSGRENICMNLKRVGFERDGGFSDYIRVPDYCFCPVDKKIPFHEMAIIGDAIGTPFHAITGLAKVTAGQDVLIVGAGGLGLHGVQIAKLSGARVIVVDKNPGALKLADQQGADYTFSPVEAPENIKDLTQGLGVDAVIEIVGHPETLSWSLPALKSGGKLILVGYAPNNPFPLNTMAMHYNEYEIIGSRFTTKVEMLQLIKLVEQGRIKPIVTQTFPFEKTNEALEALRQKKILGRIALTL